MATRPVFIPRIEAIGVRRIEIDFDWYPGFSPAQKQRSIVSLHESAAKHEAATNCLEISSKSMEALGKSLSAFNLRLKDLPFRERSVESLFQGSKVFQGGGPYTDLYDRAPLDAKRDPRLKASGELSAFSFDGLIWALSPTTAFYDWLYGRALLSNRGLQQSLDGYNGFTDIEFNPKRSLNCQAMALARFRSLEMHGMLELYEGGQELFIQKAFEDICGNNDQRSLF
jgi:hypothetical protein